jgi:hypothetical protein
MMGTKLCNWNTKEKLDRPIRCEKTDNHKQKAGRTIPRSSTPCTLGIQQKRGSLTLPQF